MTEHPAPGRALVVADDLTGANDTGVQFAEAGWSSTLQLGPAAAPASTAQAVATAVSTDSRALDHDTAAGRTRATLDAHPTAAGDVVYVKVDSTLRGSVAGQLAGALAARRGRHPDAFVVLCPAYPAMGRTVEHGVLLVHGRPVTESPAATDPVTPVREDTLAALVPGAVTVPVAPTARAWADSLAAAAERADVVAADARTDEDLDRLAAAVLLLGPRVLPAGSAGLAAPLAAAWLGDHGRDGDAPAPLEVRRPLVLVTSQHAAARRQVEAVVAAADPAVQVASTTLTGLLDGGDIHVVDADPAAVVVLLSPDERAEPAVAGRLATALAVRAANLLDDEGAGFDALVLVGGDGAEALLSVVDARGIAIRGRILEGVPVGHVVGGSADGLPVVTKAGGFGDDDTLLTLLRTLRTRTETETSR